MATKTIVTVELLDDLDPSKAAHETVVFALDGLAYEIDLTAGNAAALRKKLAPYVEKGRPHRTASRTAESRGRSRVIRKWANEQGITVPQRGRIPVAIIEKYDAAQALQSQP